GLHKIRTLAQPCLYSVACAMRTERGGRKGRRALLSPHYSLLRRVCAMALGRNKLEYEVLEGWEHLPEGWNFVEVAGVATDSHDRVYAFNRGAHPVIVFD